MQSMKYANSQDIYWKRTNLLDYIRAMETKFGLNKCDAAVSKGIDAIADDMIAN